MGTAKPTAISELPYTEYQRMTCRGCGSTDPMIDVLDLGEPYLNHFPLPGEEQDCRRFPLKVVWCQCCKLAQLAHDTPLDWNFRLYWYKSGVTATMRQELAEIVSDAVRLTGLRAGESVLDIGANDGTLLRSYPKDVCRYGFEPARNLTEIAREGGNSIIPEYFEMKSLPVELRNDAFRVVTAISMFYDLPDPDRFLWDVTQILHPTGILILQLNYVKSMLQENAFDNICHEHLTYFGLSSLLPLIERAGLCAFKVITNDINGGSFRLYCCRQYSGQTRLYQSDGSVEEVLSEERRVGLDTLRPYEAFVQRVHSIRDQVSSYVNRCQEQDERVWVYGASTRGSTTMQYFRLSGIAGAAERDSRKWGRVTSGTWLPIVSEEEGRKQADVFLVLPWHFKKEIVEREKEFLAQGKDVVFPMPVPVRVFKNSSGDVVEELLR